MKVNNKSSLVPGTATVASSLLEKPFKKIFDGEEYLGVVKQYRSHNQYFYVVYEDGDSEEMDLKELLRLLEPCELIGIRLQRNFPKHGTFEGFVESYEDAYFRIIYEDNDRETMTYRELMSSLLLQASVRKRKATEAFAPTWRRIN